MPCSGNPAGTDIRMSLKYSSSVSLFSMTGVSGTFLFHSEEGYSVDDWKFYGFARFVPVFDGKIAGIAARQDFSEDYVQREQSVRRQGGVQGLGKFAFRTVSERNDQFQQGVGTGGEQHDRGVAHDRSVVRTGQVEFDRFRHVFGHGGKEVQLFRDAADVYRDAGYVVAERAVVFLPYDDLDAGPYAPERSVYVFFAYLGLVHGVNQIVHGEVGAVVVAAFPQAEIELGKVGSAGNAGRTDGWGVVNGFVVFRSSPVNHVVKSEGEMEFPVVLAENVALHDGIISVEYGNFTVDVIAVIGGCAGIAGIDFEDAGKRIFVQGVADLRADSGSNQIIVCAVFGTFTAFGAGNNDEQSAA